MIVKVDSGKYTFRKTSLVIEVDRHGDEWLTIREGFNAIASLMAELDAARVVLQAARRAAEDHPGFYGLSDIRKALERHDCLVSDNEPPSGWTRIDPSVGGLDRD